MSYDIRLTDPETGEALHAGEPHRIAGGTYAVGGTTELWLNVTYNYAPRFRRVLGEKGIRSIYGMTGANSVPVLEAAVTGLGEDVSEDYWEATDGNARKALEGLLALARMAPHGVWAGD